ncbi:hypothetical protein [Streptomyces sp. NBC_00151]|uniref:hypothetical protein n=1 Tax=Streptomyces sp. NBC_00151 TaxID=2975669 RepID=UPI002DD9214F|nr:hypothetical protein [Streptomyces sp. NBC_00151]WRZ42769.1 hypothetical protein OG915_34890 [Streptomyces sp. NBC_00151]
MTTAIATCNSPFCPCANPMIDTPCPERPQETFSTLEAAPPRKSPTGPVEVQEAASGSFLATYAAEINEHRWKLRKRGFPFAAEHTPPTGQAALWYEEVTQYVPRSGRDVARQVARLSGEDSQVTISWRSLADAVGKRNRAGNLVSYTERGVRVLKEAGWLRVETIGGGCTAKTTFYLQVGDLADWTHLEDERDYSEDD